MNDVDIPATITAIGALVTALGVVLIAYWSYRGKERASRAADLAADATKAIVAIGDTIYLLDKRVDGRLTQLLEQVRSEGVVAADLARSEGRAQGEQAQRDRASEAQP